jgi:subtilisin family serine protease
VRTILRRATLSIMLVSIMVVATFAILVSAPISADNDSMFDAMGLQSGSPIDPALEDMMARSMGPFEVYVIATDRNEVNSVLVERGQTPILSKEFEGIPTIQLMELDARTITALAGCSGVVRIMTLERPMIEPVNIDLAKEDFIPDGAPSVNDHDVDVVHGAVDAWDLGFTGEGVVIADIDTGFDLAHPDLQGQQARYESGTYAGWPMAYDDYGAMKWSMEVIGGWIADTTTEVKVRGKNCWFVLFDGAQYNVKGLKDADGNPVKSKSGTVHMGYHTDAHLSALYGAPVAVLVVDTKDAGVYDTVYVDITHDFDFTNDKPCTKGDEISYFDYYNATTGTTDYSSWDAGDGFADLSGGMIYWIADGETVYPASDWTYGATYTGGPGDAVAFMGEFYYGESHGTMTSSAALAASRTMGGLLGGMAPGAKLMAIPFTGSVVNAWMFAQFGVDGELGTGDEADIVTNSYGWSDMAIDAGYNIVDMTAMAISTSGPTMWFWSTGNGGPGYGTCASVYDFTSVQVGAGTTMQYRYSVGYELAGEYTKWGDVIPFSNSGPSRTGKLNSEIIASGAYSCEPGPLNSYLAINDFMMSTSIGNGASHYQIGSGTSHACPTVAGAAALGFQAYEEANGDLPDKALAKAALMAAADDMHHDVFKQAAGWLNAGPYCEFMSGQGATLSMAQGPNFPTSALYPGDIYGTSYEAFPNFMVPGATEVEVVTTANNDDEETTVDISSQLLIRTGSEEFSVILRGMNEKYVDITDLIPEGTDLLKATMYCPMEEFDPELDTYENFAYALELHDWVDLNGNGKMDAVVKSPGVWELFRYTIDGSTCNYNVVQIKDPLERTTDGLIVRIRPWLAVPNTEWTVQLDFYALQEFPWVKFRMADTDDPFTSTLETTVPAGGEVSWEAEISVPSDAPVGTYGAGIYIDDGSRVQCMPVVINVPATTYEFEFGGESLFDTPFNNDVVGITDKYWRFEVGDWRMYWCLPEESLEVPSSDAYLIAGVEWTELPTDINVHVMGPALADPEDALTGIFCEYGPGYYERITASSDERYLGGGVFDYYTNTGGPKEVIASPMGACLDEVGGPAPFAVLTRCPLMAGHSPSDTPAGYVKWITINDMGVDPTEVTIDLSEEDPLEGEISGWFDITVQDELDVSVSTENQLMKSFYPDEEIFQGALSGDFESDLANSDYTRVLNLVQCNKLVVQTAEVADAPDIDLAVWRDLDMDGVADMTEPFWTSGTSGSNEIVTLVNPADGQYLVKVLGYTVMGDPGYFSLLIMYGVIGATMSADFDETQVGSGTYTFDVTYTLPAIEGVYIGAVMFGFDGTDEMFRIEVTFTVTA